MAGVSPNISAISINMNGLKSSGTLRLNPQKAVLTMLTGESRSHAESIKEDKEEYFIVTKGTTHQHSFNVFISQKSID